MSKWIAVTGPTYLCRVHFERGHWGLFDKESAL
jgi:hypothetical protein